MAGEDEARRRAEAERREPVGRPGHEGRSSDGGEPKVRRKVGGIRWGRIAYYFSFVLLVAFAWYFLFGFLYGLAGSNLALGLVQGLSWYAGQVAAFAVLAYRTPERPLVHLLPLALLVWLAYAVFVPWVDSFAAWLVNGIFVVLLAFVGFGVGVGARALKTSFASPTGVGEPARQAESISHEDERAERGDTDEVGGSTIPGEGDTDFREADLRYAKLKRRHDAGEIGGEEFDARLEELTVRDREGRRWVKTRETGEWMYYDGSAWVRGTPSVYRQTMPEYSPQRAGRGPDAQSGTGRTGLWVVSGVFVASW